MAGIGSPTAAPWMRLTGAHRVGKTELLKTKEKYQGSGSSPRTNLYAQFKPRRRGKRALRRWFELNRRRNPKRNDVMARARISCLDGKGGRGGKS